MNDVTALVLVETALSVDSIAPLLSPYGLRDFAQADDHIRALTITHPARSEFARFLPRILEAVSRSADPDAALRHFRHYANARSDKHSFYGMMKAMPPLLDDLMVTFGGSDYLAALLIRHPDYLAWWRETLARNPERVKEEMEADLRDWLRRFHTTDTRLGILRRFKRRESLRIGMRDLLKASSVEQTVKEMAYVADVCFQLAYEMGRAELDAKYGVPMEVDGDPARYAVIGMGKLGGTELNFSSDVDVLAVYSAEGKTTKGSANQAYFIRLTEFIIHAMTEPTSEGYVFRTDLRLRPQGASGGLARSLDSYIGYYETWGELFERQALIKARCVAGDEALGEEFLDAIQPFVYQTIVDQETVEDVLEEIHRTKLVKIEERIAKDGDPRLHVKLGPGGIRDVEFVVQALQLLHGGRLRDLRLRGTAETIEALERRGIFNPEDAARLTDSYHYMRRVENFVQLVADKQSYRLPEDPEDWERQARRLGYRDSDDQTAGDQFRDEYETHQRTIRAMFNKVFALEPDLFRDLINRILDEDEPTDETAQFLESYGLNDAKRAHQLLNEMSKGAGQVRYTPRVRRAFRKFVASLFEELRATPDPMLSLLQFVNFLSASKSRTQTYAMLQENRPTLQALIKTLGTSKFLGEILVREPLLFETLTYGSDINEKKTTVQAFLENLETGCDLSGDELLRHVQRVRLGELLRIGTRDILGESDVFQTTLELSLLAEAVVTFFTDKLYEHLVESYGEPRHEDGAPATFAVIGMGKIAGREINYSSDLDVQFVYSDEGKTTKGRPNTEFFQRLATTTINQFKRPILGGVIYELDMRLRPYGRGGPVALSLAGYAKYYEQHAEFWERQASIRARSIAGDPVVGNAYLEIAFAYAYSAPLTPEEAGQIHHVRGRKEDKAAKETSRIHNLKSGYGGLVDIEFLVQALQLHHGSENLSVRTANTTDAIRRLNGYGHLSNEDADFLLESYRFLRFVEDRLQIVENRPLNALPDDQDALDKLARRLGYDSTDDTRPSDRFLDDYHALTDRVRNLFSNGFRRLGVEVE